SFLVTRSLSDAATLGHYLTETLPTIPEPRRSRQRQAVAIALGKFLANLHLAGVCHPDLHPGNLLVTWIDSTPQFTLIDLHDCRVGVKISETARLNNLVSFNRWFFLRATRSDRLRFWRAYCVASMPTALTCNAVESLTIRSNLRFWRGREKRCLLDSRH